MVMLPTALVEAGRRAQQDPLDLLFPGQREMVEELLKPGGRVADHSGRGSGKTEGVAHGCQRLMRTVENCRIAWVGLTRQSAMDNCWHVMRRVNNAFGGYLRESEHKARWYSPSGGTFAVFGANKADELEKFRGQAYHLVIIDESASFKRQLLKYLVEDVIEPRLVDFNGSLALIGTPGAAKAGYYYEACHGYGGFRVFRRDMRSNPHFDNADEWMRAQRERKGWDEDHPTYRREYLGEWVIDTESLVSKFTRERNLITTMPADYRPGGKGWSHLLGIDFGVVDSTAWTVYAARAGNTNDRRAYIPWSGKWHAGIPERFYEGLGITPGRNGKPGDDLAPSDAAAVTERIRAEFGCYPIVGDTGGIGKGFQVEANKRYGLNIRAANKVDKLAGIELWNDGFTSGDIALLESGNGDLVEELQTVQWKVELYDQSVGGVIKREERRVIDPRFECHLFDSARYPYPEVRAWRNRKLPATMEELERKDPGEHARREAIQRSMQRREAAWWDE